MLPFSRKNLRAVAQLLDKALWSMDRASFLLMVSIRKGKMNKSIQKVEPQETLKSKRILRSMKARKKPSKKGRLFKRSQKSKRLKCKTWLMSRKINRMRTLPRCKLKKMTSCKTLSRWKAVSSKVQRTLTISDQQISKNQVRQGTAHS